MADWLVQVGELPSVVFLAVLGVVMMLDAIPLLGVLVPGDVAVLAAVGVGRPASVSAFLAVIGGCLGGWSLTFFAGRRFGARLRRSRTGAWIGEARWAAAERMLGSGGGRMVMVAPFLPVLNALLPLAAGGLRMSYRRFVGFAAVGAVLWAGLYMALGTVARSVGGLLPGESFALLGTVAFGMVFGGLVLLGVRRRLATTVEAGPVPS
ncbi:DedA family protein [Plantactinospora solaniradicis]|uniref:DedA family protein n=1 Tax=Plantactinospora solaniradicis TaxID=1723736 RepID=A0ABW1KHA5_9ACTN